VFSTEEGTYHTSHNSRNQSARTWNKSATKGGLKAATKGAAEYCKEAELFQERPKCCKGGRTVAREQSATLKGERNNSV
jgi:hypothetical protein